MASFLLLAFTNCQEGREEEFNRWYDSEHLPQACAVPGVIRGFRLERVSSFGNESDPKKFQHLAIYEVEADDPHQFLDTLNTYLADGRIQRAKLYDGPAWTVLYRVSDR